MKSTKHFSGSNAEKAFIPSVMRALYYSPGPSMEMENLKETPSPGTTTSTVSEDVDTAAGLMLDTSYPTPQPTGHQYLIRVQTAAFCQDEIRLAQALNPKNNTPKIPLHSICGTVITTPPQDQDRPLGPRFRVGDVVFGVLSYSREGAAADYVIAYEGEIARKPENICPTKAAALALPALTAWEALFRYAGLDPDAVAKSGGVEKGDGKMAEAAYGVGYNNGYSRSGGVPVESRSGGVSGTGSGGFSGKVSGSGSGSGSGMIPATNTNGYDSGYGYGTGGERKASRASMARASLGSLIGLGNGNRNSSSGSSGRASTAPNGNAVMNGYSSRGSVSGGPSNSAEGGRKLSWANVRRVSLGSNSGGHSGNGVRKKKSRHLRVLVTNPRNNEVGRITVELLRADKLFSQVTSPPWICVTCSTAAEETAVRNEWDVDDVLIIPHLPTSNECDVGAMFRERGWEAVDMVLDCIGGEVFRQAHSIVRDGGAVLTAVDPWPAMMPADAMDQDPLGRRKRKLTSRFVPVTPDGGAMARIAELVEDETVTGREEVVVDLLRAAKLLDSGGAGAAGARRGAMMTVRINKAGL